MRDLLVAAIVFGSLPFILKRPFWGILMLAWLGYMNPHRLCYGFMYSMPSVFIVTIVTLIGMLASREAKRMIWSREIVLLVILVIWMGLTTSQAFHTDQAIVEYEKVLKIQILTVMTLLMLTTRDKVNLFIWIIALSLGFYGVKGGIFTIIHGGVYHVWGPAGSFIAGNNELALALVMTIPLMRYLQLQEKHRFIKLGLLVAMLLTAISAVGSQSRGALIALVITGAFFWLKSRNKLFIGIFIALTVIVAANLMPAAWYQRMDTIGTYDQDASAIGRLNAWSAYYHMANDRFMGGGFHAWGHDTFALYAPDPTNVRDVHSIYFQMLGEHGYFGFALFLALLILTWLKCGTIIRAAKRNPDFGWARDLAAMIQVSIPAYMSAGAFLGLAYFDYIYHLIAVVVVLHQLVVVDGSTNRIPVSSGSNNLEPNPKLKTAVGIRA